MQSEGVGGCGVGHNCGWYQQLAQAESVVQQCVEYHRGTRCKGLGEVSHSVDKMETTIISSRGGWEVR